MQDAVVMPCLNAPVLVIIDRIAAEGLATDTVLADVIRIAGGDTSRRSILDCPGVLSAQNDLRVGAVWAQFSRNRHN
jgi:hypothetical protein